MSNASDTSRSLAGRLEKVHAGLSAQEKKLINSRNLSIFAGLLVLVLGGAYFFYGYKSLSEGLEAPELIGIAEGFVDRNIPTAREALEKQIDESADDWAAGLSKQAIAALPTASKKLEDYAVTQVDDALNQVVLIQDDQFRSFLKENHDVLEKAFADLATSPKLSEDALKQIGSALEDKLQVDLAAKVKELFGAIINLNAKLIRLKEGKDLAPDELLERRILLLANRLKLNESQSQAKAAETAQDSASNEPAANPVN